MQSEQAAAQLHRRVLRLMGNRFEISVVENDPARAEQCIDAAIEEISRIERLLTTFNEHSQTQKINANAGIRPVAVDQEVIDLIRRSLQLSRLTQGAFDITYGSIDKRLWNFDLSMKSLPDPDTARKLVRLINYRNVLVDEENQTVFLKEPGMRIGFGGIGKGYAADRAKQVLQQLGIASGIVNAAGDLVTWDSQPNGKAWTVGIASPDQPEHFFSSLDISNKAIATSGNYEKFVMIDGKRYSHTIDPKTGFPVSGIKSVTIISPHAELSDAMATPVMVMGVRAGLDLINQVKGISCILVDDTGDIHTSRNINLIS